VRFISHRFGMQLASQVRERPANDVVSVMSNTAEFSPHLAASERSKSRTFRHHFAIAIIVASIPLERIAAIEKHLGINEKIAA
jgi:hypothetical protein